MRAFPTFPDGTCLAIGLIDGARRNQIETPPLKTYSRAAPGSVGRNANAFGTGAAQGVFLRFDFNFAFF